MTPVQDRGQALLGLTALGLGFGLPDRRLLRGLGAGQLGQLPLDLALAALSQLLAERVGRALPWAAFLCLDNRKQGNVPSPLAPVTVATPPV